MTEKSEMPGEDGEAMSTALTPEARLEASRELLRSRMVKRRAAPAGTAENASGALFGAFGPVLADLVRRHPYAMLSGAAVTGALLVQSRSLRVLGSAFFTPMAQKAVATSVAAVMRGAGRPLYTARSVVDSKVWP